MFNKGIEGLLYVLVVRISEEKGEEHLIYLASCRNQHANPTQASPVLKNLFDCCSVV